MFLIIIFFFLYNVNFFIRVKKDGRKWWLLVKVRIIMDYFDLENIILYNLLSFY